MSHFVFDVNQTLSDMSPLDEVLRTHGAPAGLASGWFASVLRDGFALSLHGSAPAFLDLAREDLVRSLTAVRDDLDAPVDRVVEQVLDRLGSLGVHDDVPAGVRALTEAGHRLTAFSNGSGQATRGLLDRAGVLDGFEHVLSVEGGPGWKPHPGAYARAAEQLAAAPADLTMVAAHPWDLDGAGRAGLRTAWLDRDGLPWPDSFRRADHRVTTVGGLAVLGG